MLSVSHPARRFSVLLIASFLSGACTKSDSTPSAGSTATAGAPTSSASSNADEDLADITKYRLSMDKLDKYFAAQRNLALKAKDLTPAQREAMEMGNSTEANASLDDMVRNIEKQPMMVDAVKAAGLSPREFTMITISMMQTAMAAGVAKMRPNDNQDSLIREMKANPDNIKFYNANEAEIMRKGNELAAEMKKLGISQ